MNHPGFSELSEEQQTIARECLEFVLDWYDHPRYGRDQFYIVNAAGGTGKTFTEVRIAHFLRWAMEEERRLPMYCPPRRGYQHQERTPASYKGQSVEPLDTTTCVPLLSAFTNRAANVLRDECIGFANRHGIRGDLVACKTVISTLRRSLVEDEETRKSLAHEYFLLSKEPERDPFRLQELHEQLRLFQTFDLNHTVLRDFLEGFVLLLDEASFLNREVAHWCASFQVPIIVFLDHCQLPPVTDPERKGQTPWFLNQAPNGTLKKVRRQDKGPILTLLTDIRDGDIKAKVPNLNNIQPYAMRGVLDHIPTKNIWHDRELLKKIKPSKIGDLALLVCTNKNVWKINKAARDALGLYDAHLKSGVPALPYTNYEKPIDLAPFPKAGEVLVIKKRTNVPYQKWGRIPVDCTLRHHRYGTVEIYGLTQPGVVTKMCQLPVNSRVVCTSDTAFMFDVPVREGKALTLPASKVRTPDGSGHVPEETILALMDKDFNQNDTPLSSYIVHARVPEKDNLRVVLELNPIPFLTYLDKNPPKEMPYWSLSGKVTCDYDYGSTVHKAQGGQWTAVAFQQDCIFRDKRQTNERLLYTALSRTKKRLRIYGPIQFFEKGIEPGIEASDPLLCPAPRGRRRWKVELSVAYILGIV